MYTDEELHKMVEDAMKRGDNIVGAALTAAATAHEQGKDANFLEYVLMWLGFHLQHEEGDHGQRDLTAIDPNAVINL